MRIASVADMRGILVILAVAACDTGEVSALNVEPARLDLGVQLDAPSPETFASRARRPERGGVRVTRGGTAVTAHATAGMAGAPLGTVAAGGFHSDGRTGGRAT